MEYYCRSERSRPLSWVVHLTIKSLSSHYRLGLPQAVRVDLVTITDLVNCRWPQDWPGGTPQSARDVAPSGGLLAIYEDASPEHQVIAFATFDVSESALGLIEPTVNELHARVSRGWLAIVWAAQSIAYGSGGLPLVRYDGTDPVALAGLRSAGMAPLTHSGKNLVIPSRPFIVQS